MENSISLIQPSSLGMWQHDWRLNCIQSVFLLLMEAGSLILRMGRKALLATALPFQQYQNLSKFDLESREMMER